MALVHLVTTNKLFCSISQIMRKPPQPVCIAEEEIREETVQKETEISKSCVCIDKNWWNQAFIHEQAPCRHKTRQQHVFIPKDRKAFSKL